MRPAESLDYEKTRCIKISSKSSKETIVSVKGFCLRGQCNLSTPFQSKKILALSYLKFFYVDSFCLQNDLTEETIIYIQKWAV